MANKSFLFLTVLSLVVFSTQAVNICTVIANNNAFFNLCPYTKAGTKATTPPVFQGDTVAFTLVNPNTDGCTGSGSDKVYGTLTGPDASTPGGCDNFATSAPSYSLVDSSNATSGLVMTFPKNDKSKLQLVVTLNCDSSMSSDNLGSFVVSQNANGILSVTATSLYGCPVFTLSAFIEIIDEHRIPFAIGTIVIGLFITFFGLKVFHVTIFLVTFVLMTLIAGVLFFTFVTFGTQAWIKWVVFAFCIIVGLTMGYVSVKFEKFGFFALGAFLGVIGGLFLYTAVLSNIHGIENTMVPYYVTLVGCALIGGGLTFWLWKDMIIIATSFIGGYMTIRGISLVAGHFPNEILIAKGLETMTAFAYIYLAGAIVMAALGMFYQYYVRRKEREAEEDPVVSYYKA